MDGINRYCGSSVRVYRPQKGEPHSVCGINPQSGFLEDTQGNIWFGTENALNRFDRFRGNFDCWHLAGISSHVTNTVHNVFHLDQQNYLWAVAGDTLYCADTRHPEKRVPLHSLVAMRCAVSTDKQGEVKQLYACFWDLGQGFEVVSYDKQRHLTRRDTFFAQLGFPAKFTLTVRQAIVESDSLVWLTTDQGLLAFNPQRPGQFQIYHQGSIPNIRFIENLSSTHLLVASNEGRLLPFDKKTRRFGPHLTSASHSMKGAFLENISHFQLDRDSNLWSSIYGEGLLFSKLGQQQVFHPHAERPETKSGVTNIFEERKGRVLCISNPGEVNVALASDGNHFTLSSYSKLFHGSYGSIWNISASGLSHIGPNSTIKLELAAEGQAYYDCAVFQGEWIFIGTLQGLLLFNTKTHRLQAVETGVPDTETLFLDNQNRLWASTTEHLYLWTIQKNMTLALLKRFDNTGLANHIVQAPAGKNIWAATSKGLLKIWQEKDNTWHDSLLTERDGLPNQYIYAIVPDKKGNLWLSSNQGIIKYMPDQPKGAQFKQYTTRNGLSSNEYSPGAALMSSTGEIWFGSTHGVDVFHPDSVRDIGTAPQLAIVGLKIHDNEWHSDTVCIEMAQRIQLPYDQNTLRLELAAMEYTDPEMNKFRARLLNTEQLCANTTWWGRWKAWAFGSVAQPDTAWAELGTQNFITYANLQSGDYRFEFTACNAEGIWQKTPRQLVIIIAPPYWETWWFRSLIIGLILGIVGFGTAFYYRYRLRVQQLELERQQREADRKQLLLENELALQQERNRIADEMHDELGGGLATIRLSSERARKMDSADELKTILGRVSQISIGLISNMRGIIWAMDTQNDSLDSLLSYLRQYARTFLDDNAIKSNIQMPTERLDLSLTGQYRHSILLTVKECLNNILKHADASEVWLHAATDAELVIHIRDNGKGFDPEEKVGSGKGLRTTAKRMESVGGSIEWIQNPEGGMTTVLRAPL